MPLKIAELSQEFEGLDPEEKLELLVEMADSLPELSPGRGDLPFPPECRVKECQTPVYLWVDVDRGTVRLEADVPERSPTVRGLVAFVVLGLNGATVAEVASAPDDVLSLLGLETTLGMTRQQGIRGVMARIKREVAAKAEAVGGGP